MKYLKSLSLIFILVGSFFIVPKSSNAHFCTTGSESQGYLVMCAKPRGHAGPNAIKFYFENNFPSSYKTYTMSGLQRWNQTGVVNIHVTTPSYTQNVIKTYYDANTSTYAFVNIAELDEYDYNHIKRWFMSYNTFTMAYRTTEQRIVTAAHEFGHTIGLEDLKQASNINRLMYAYGNVTANSPTSYDIKGAKEAIK